MEFINIDFGNFKATIASSKENGKIICDETGKRSIKTALELSKPFRKFGNNITGECEQVMSSRFRSFRDLLDDKEGQKNIMMFLKYLDNIIKLNTPSNPYVSLSVPTFFDEKQRRYLLDICRCAGLRIERFYSDIIGPASFACIRRENKPKNFIIFDFGFSKTQAAYFTFENDVLTPKYFNSLKLGSRDFDEKIVNFILDKYNAPKSKLNKEKMIRIIDKFKSTLNATNETVTSIYFGESPVEIKLTKEEYLNLIEDEIKALSNFVEKVFEDTEPCDSIELIGGNANSFIVKNLFAERENVHTTLDTSESCALGNVLAFACSSLNLKYKINDVLGRDIYIKIAGADSKTTKLFDKGDLINSSKNVTYNRKGSFEVEIIEDDAVIGHVKVEKDASEEAVPIKLLFKISPFGTIDCINVEGDGVTKYTHETFKLTEEELDDMKTTEMAYVEIEKNISKIGDMRNELETMAMKLADGIEENFSDIFGDEDINKVKEIAMDLFDIQPSVTLEEEENVRKLIHDRFGFITTKLNEKSEKISNELQELKESINQFKNENKKMFTPSFYKIQGVLFKIDEFLKKLDLSLYNVSDFNKYFVSQIKKDVIQHINNAKKEIKDKLEEEAKQEELKKKQEEENKKEEGKAKEESTEAEVKPNEKTFSESSSSDSKPKKNSTSKKNSDSSKTDKKSGSTGNGKKNSKKSAKDSKHDDM